jgi:hypothetical protein
MKAKIILLITTLSGFCSVDAQISPTPGPGGFVTKHADVQVSRATDVPHSEESIAIDKNNPLSLIISANTAILESTTSSAQGFYISTDGGATWTANDQLPNSGIGFGDPCVAFDAADNSYMLNLGVLAPFATNEILSQTSDNEGSTWSSQVPVAGSPSSAGFDKEMGGAIDVSATSPFVNFFYSAWTNFDVDQGFSLNPALQFNRSTDGGSTFSTPIVLKSGFNHGASVATGPNGEVYVAWADYTGIGSNPMTIGPGKQIGFASDPTNGGASLSGFTVSDAFAESGLNDPDGTATTVFGGTRMGDFPSIAVDKSCGSFRGRIYLAYTDGFESGTNLVKIRSSDNDGATWSGATTLNITIETGTAQAFFPAVAVDDLTGLVNVVFYSIDNPSTFATETMVSYSTDGGSSWQSILANDVSHITAPINCSSCFVGFPEGYAGDYIGICSFGGHSFATWHDNRTGQWQVYVAQIDYNLTSLFSSQTNLDINAPSSIMGNVIYAADNNIVSSSDGAEVSIAAGANIIYKAGHQVLLTNGFTASDNSNFTAEIVANGPCQTPGVVSDLHLSQNPITTTLAVPTNNILYSYPNPTNGNIVMGLKSGIFDRSLVLEIKDLNGQTINLFNVPVQTNGSCNYEFNTSELSAGIYFFSFISSNQVSSSRFVKLN